MVVLRLAILIALALRLAAADQPRLSALAGSDGALRVSVGERELGAFIPGAADPGWRFVGAAPAAGKDGDRHFSIAIGGTQLAGIAAGNPEGTAAAARWELTPAAEVKLNSIHVTGEFPIGVLAGGKWQLDDRNGTFPAQLDQPALVDGQARFLTITTADGTTLTLAFAQPTHVMLQDNRRWGGGTFSVRIGPGAGTFKAGEAVRIAFALSSPGGVDYAVDHPITITAGAEWIPLKQDSLEIEPGSALDLSDLVERVAPAGKLGRVIVTADGRFAFEKDRATSRRFYGANLCFTAQYLTHEDADRLVERLARLGYNAIRIHHYEGELVGHKPGAPQFVPDKLDQLDYLLAACGKRGIYATTDLLVSRPIGPEQLGLPAGSPVNPKILIPVLPAAFEDWKAFTVALLGHVNPYTKLRWADDPTLAWIAMINEGNFENYWNDIRVSPQWKTAWNTWLAKTYADRSALAKTWGDTLAADEDPAQGSVALPTDLNRPDLRARDAARFAADTEQAMFRRMRDEVMLKELNCHALLSNSSSWTNRAASQIPRADYDYDDDHFYVDHPEFVEQAWRLPSRIADRDPLLDGATGGTSCAFTGLAGRPVTITEFNYAAPSRHRAMGGLLTGALAALQDWSAIWRFAYAHQREIVLGPHPLDYFDVGADPLNQAAERAALCLFLRGDAQPAKHRIALAIRPADVADSGAPMPHLAPRWTWAAWLTGVRTALVDEQHPLPPGFDQLAMAAPANGVGAYALDDATLLDRLRGHGVETGGVHVAQHRLLSETGEIRILGDEERLIVDTPRSAGGFARPGGAIDAEHAGLRAEPQGVPATVFASALDGQPLRTSHRILASHLTEVLDEGMTFAEQARHTLTAWGKLPHLVRAGSARITLTLDQPTSYRVWALSTTGKRLAPVEAAVKDGALSFTAEVAGPDGARMLYELVRE